MKILSLATAVMVAATVITTVTTVNSNSSVLAQDNPWVYMGQADTGESIYVNAQSLYHTDSGIAFIYKIGGEVINAVAYCGNNQWYAEGYGVYSPQSAGTQNLLNYVCGADL